MCYERKITIVSISLANAGGAQTKSGISRCATPRPLIVWMGSARGITRPAGYGKECRKSCSYLKVRHADRGHILQPPGAESTSQAKSGHHLNTLFSRKASLVAFAPRSVADYELNSAFCAGPPTIASCSQARFGTDTTYDLTYMYALVFVSNIEGVALNTKLGKVKRNGNVTSCICQRR